MLSRIINGIVFAAIFGGIFVEICNVAIKYDSNAFSALSAMLFFESFVIGFWYAIDKYLKEKKF